MKIGNGRNRRSPGNEKYMVKVNTSIDPVLKAKLESLFHDPLTGMPRRGYFAQLIDELLTKRVKKLDPSWEPAFVERTEKQCINHLHWQSTRKRRIAKRKATITVEPQP